MNKKILIILAVLGLLVLGMNAHAEHERFVTTDAVHLPSGYSITVVEDTNNDNTIYFVTYEDNEDFKFQVVTNEDED